MKQLANPNGCFADASVPIAGCASGRALLGTAPFFGSHAVALSADGRNLYAAAFNSDSIAVFTRNRTTGKLTQNGGAAGCIANLPAPGCATGRALLKPTSVAVSADGKSVYAASIVGSSVAVFNRNASTGSLTQKSGAAGCVAATTDRGCAVGRELDGADVVGVSPDGRNVYVGAFESDSVAVFDRNRSTGSIKQKSNAAGCITQTASAGCATGRGLDGAEGLTVSPDGKSVYVGAAIGNAVAAFRRNRTTGTLAQTTGASGCAAFRANEGCANGDGLVGADSMVVSPDNKNLYVASGVGDSVAIFKRSTKSGRITQLGGIGGCYTDHKHDLGRCSTGVQLDGPEGIAISPGGDTVYVGSFFSSAVAVFDRTSFNGTIVQRAGVNGCIVNVATSGCTTGTALGSANALAISRDGRSVYVGAYASNAVATFARAIPPSGRVKVSVPSRLQVPSGYTAFIPVACGGSKSRRCPGGIRLSASASRLGTGSAGQSTIGRGSFNVPGAQRQKVTIALSAAARRYLRRNQSLPATVTMRVVEPQGQITVFRQDILLFVSGLG